MQTEGQKRKEKVIQWHEDHLGYYADFLNKVSGPGHESLQTLMFRVWSVDHHIYQKVEENMEGAGLDTVKLEGKKQKSFGQQVADGIDRGDDFYMAISYWVMFGDGFEQMFLMLENTWLNKTKRALSIGIIPMLMRKYEKNLIEASIKGGYRTAEQWLEYEAEYNEGREDGKIDISSTLSKIVPAIKALTSEVTTAACFSPYSEEAEKKLMAAMRRRDENVKLKIVHYIEDYLTDHHSGIDAAHMMIALDESGVMVVEDKNFKKPYDFVYALNIPNLVGYRMAQAAYAKIISGFERSKGGPVLSSYRDDRKEIDNINAKLKAIIDEMQSR